MAEIRPFRGWRYNPTNAGDLSQLIAPPYDVISPAEQQSLYARSPYNVVRLELTPPELTDPPGPEGDAARHARARETLETWAARGILLQDQDPSLYLYEQTFSYGGTTRSRRSLMAAVRLSPWSAGEVLPHEHTLSQPKVERLGLLRATAANISPIWSLYEDRHGQIGSVLEESWSMEPSIAAVDDEGTRHSIRVVQQREAATRVMEAFSRQTLYIADGHHRYETALAYQEEARLAGGRTAVGPRDLVMMVLTAVDEEGLLVLPTYRLVHDVPVDRLAALDRLMQHDFTVSEMAVPADPAALQSLLDANLLTAGGDPVGHRFALLGPEPDRLRFLSLREAAAAGIRGSDPLATLDVSLAHRLILDRMLGIDAEGLARQEHLTYTRDAAEALAAVRSGRSQLALFLAHTPVKQLLAVADARAVMPQKSTYFYPKPATGLVIRRLQQP